MSKDSRKDSDKDRHIPILEHALTRCSVSRSSPGRAGVGAGRPMQRRRLSRRVLRRVRACPRWRDDTTSVQACCSCGVARPRGRRSRSTGTEACQLALCRSRSPAVAALVRSRRRSRSRSARFASVLGRQSTGRHCARCWRRSGRLVDDRASSWVVDLDCDGAGRFPPRHGLAGDAGERGLWSRSVLMCRTRLCGGGALTPARVGHGWIPPPAPRADVGSPCAVTPEGHCPAL